MAWCTPYQIFLIVVFVITGSINSIVVKWADLTESVGRDGKARHFDHPFFQAGCMFISELLCFVMYKLLFWCFKRKGEGFEDEHILTRGNRDFNVFLLAIPATCDLIGTSIMYIGLTLTYVSSFQMFRGFVIVFVGLFTMCILGRMLGLKQWLGIFLVIGGLALVGLADMLSVDPSGHTTAQIFAGDIMIVCAQLFVAFQMVIEEKYISGLDIAPLHAAGWEGVFGFTFICLMQYPLYLIRPGPPISRRPLGEMEDPYDALVQISNSWTILSAVLMGIISIAFYNFAGISITKELSAVNRKVLDSIRTILVWTVSVLCFGQAFNYIQLVGFLIMIFGIILYHLVRWSDLLCCAKPEEAT